ncbi:E3 ubiquitin/ISG15 ligase TRIM25-like [Pseudophryne corroboree]|uniref:E3 ubiquitin/ISG15 ligase TRIM25-like n=1 Tax=Pseudophryne corroboree TaxID=495146 RepID=UPI0030816DAD
MASAELKEELNCSICLSIYTDPAVLSCGHNFCRLCISRVLDTQEEAGLYTCPECRAEFQERPTLQKNMKLCNIVECFLTSRPVQEQAGIFCTYCVHCPVPAVKTCLQCETSLCEIHLQAHSKLVEHTLTYPTTSLENRKCSIHKKLLEYYCPEDAACICVSCCAFGEHRGHQVALLYEASKKKKDKLRLVMEKLTSKREETEKRTQSLREHRQKVEEKASSITERVTLLFKEIREHLEVLEKRVLSEITGQEEQVSLHVSDLIQQLEIEKEELSKKMRHIEELCNIMDPLTVLRGRESDATNCDNEEEDHKDKKKDVKNVQAVCDLDEGLISVILHTGLTDIVTGLKSKRGFHMQVASDILLDVYTAGDYVAVSRDFKMASWSETKQCRPKTPERFVNYHILSTKIFTSGQNYWEVEASELGYWMVGLAYPSIERKGDRAVTGYNKKSWCLRMSDKTHSAIHDSKINPLYPDISVQRLGIYLDYEAGRLSFYQICGSIRHLHTFITHFTEPLHAAFCVYNNSWVRIRS